MWEKMQEQNWKDFTMRSMRQITQQAPAAAVSSPMFASSSSVAAPVPSPLSSSQGPLGSSPQQGGAVRKSRMPDEVVEWLQREGFYQCVIFPEVFFFLDFLCHYSPARVA